MKQPRRWAMPLVALLMAASLAYAPCEGSTRPIPRLVSGDPRPTQEMGGPNTPPDPRSLVSCRVWFSSAMLARGFQVDFAIVVGAQKRPAGSQIVRFAPRVTANP
jgi:hypothetical protein